MIEQPLSLADFDGGDLIRQRWSMRPRQDTRISCQTSDYGQCHADTGNGDCLSHGVTLTAICLDWCGAFV